MAETEIRERVSELLQQVGQAHHAEFIHVGGEDPEWPLWYAERLHEGLSDLLDIYLTGDEVATALADAERDRMDKDPSAAWADYYADWMVEQYLEGG